MSTPLIDFDLATFSPTRIMPVTHRLSEHPLLQLPSLVALAERLARKNAVRYHNDKVQMGTDFTTAPETHKVERPAAEVVADIENAKSWLALHNIQQDPEYCVLLDEVLDDLRPRLQSKDPGMCYRAGWIFVTSPNAVTPYHMDHENNFILQIRGKKQLYVWDPLDRDIITERCLELFHSKGSRELVTYRDDLKAKAKVFDLEPGMGGYMPRTAPHSVQNGDNVSITVSFTYYTDETRRTKLLHQANAALRKRGVTPTPVGQSVVVDAAKSRVFGGLVWGRNRVARLRGNPALLTDTRYAPA